MTAEAGEIIWYGASDTPSGWLPCNGAFVSQSTYADLYSVLGLTHGGITSAWPTMSLAAGVTEQSVAYGNGYWVAVGNTGGLSYATDPAGTWTNNAQGSGNFRGVAYGNGYWVAVGQSGKLYYRSTDPTGSWTSNTQGSVQFSGVVYGGGYWVAVGDNGTLYYRATDPTGAWTSNTQGTVTFLGVDYDGTNFVGVGGFAGTSVLRYASDPTGAWTSNVPAGETKTFNAVTYANGYWLAVGNTGMVYYATSASGTWTSNTQGSLQLTSAAYANGWWVIDAITGGPWIRNASDPTSTFVNNTTTWLATTDVFAQGNIIVAVGGSGSCRYVDTSTFAVPALASRMILGKAASGTGSTFGGAVGTASPHSHTGGVGHTHTVGQPTAHGAHTIGQASDHSLSHSGDSIADHTTPSHAFTVAAHSVGQPAAHSDHTPAAGTAGNHTHDAHSTAANASSGSGANTFNAPTTHRSAWNNGDTETHTHSDAHTHSGQDVSAHSTSSDYSNHSTQTHTITSASTHTVTHTGADLDAHSAHSGQTFGANAGTGASGVTDAPYVELASLIRT